MKLTIEKQELNRVLGVVNGVIDKHAPLPILSNVLLVAQGGTLVVTASNGDVSTKTKTTNLQIEEEGAILIDGVTISNAVGKLNGDITIVNKDNKVVINNDKAKYSLNTASTNEYPKIDFAHGDEFILNGNEFNYALDKVINSVATSAERPIFTGVNIQSKGNELEFTSTDSYRLSKSYLELSQETELNVTVLANTLRSIMKIAKDKELNVSSDGTRVTFRTENTIFVTRLVDGLYPDTARLIPNDYKSHVTVNRQDLIKAVDRASFMREDNIWILNLDATYDTLKLVTKAQEIGRTYEELPIELKGEEISINLNGKYLLDALNSLEDKDVTFNFVGQLQALTVSDTTNQVQLLLPIRV